MGTLFSALADAFSQIGMIFHVMGEVWFLVLPPALYSLFVALWLPHVWGHFGSKIRWVVLELIPPRDIEKSPQPMESIYTGFAGSIKGFNTAEEWVKGEYPTSFSLELVSTEGKVHFYVRTQVGFRNLVEAHFYAQYPDIEIVEVPDYVNQIPRTVPNKDWDLWGSDFELVKDDAYPIKTYKSFEESVTGKMIDPLAGLIEAMSKVGPGQHMWLQLITTPINEKWYASGKAIVDKMVGRAEKEKPKGILERLFIDFKDIFVNIVPGIMGKELSFSTVAEAEKKPAQPLEASLTLGERDVLKAIEANIGKQMFRIRMRYLYIGRREAFSKPTGVSAFVGGIKQFNDGSLNSFKPEDTMKTEARYIFVEPRLRFTQRRIFNRYIWRDPSPDKTRFVLSTEELATIYHIPDMQVVAPALSRVAAKRGGAPLNLPVQEE